MKRQEWKKQLDKIATDVRTSAVLCGINNMKAVQQEIPLIITQHIKALQAVQRSINISRQGYLPAVGSE